MAEGEAFTEYIRTTYNSDYAPVFRNTKRIEIFRVVEEQKKCLLQFCLLYHKVALLVVGKLLTTIII